LTPLRHEVLLEATATSGMKNHGGGKGKGGRSKNCIALKRACWRDIYSYNQDITETLKRGKCQTGASETSGGRKEKHVGFGTISKNTAKRQGKKVWTVPCRVNQWGTPDGHHGDKQGDIRQSLRKKEKNVLGGQRTGGPESIAKPRSVIHKNKK